MRPYLLSLLIACVGCTAQEVPPVEVSRLPVNAAWAASALWDDGQAEVARYQATRVIYGKPREYEQVMITVKEDFNREFNVKTDTYDRTDLFTVMKVNLFGRIPTIAYPYHYLTSIFLPRSDAGSVHKLTMSSQEWCGNTFKAFTRTDSTLRLRYDSYWDGEGAGQRSLEVGGVFEDQLVYSLRALDVAAVHSFKLPVYPSVVTSKVGDLKPIDAGFTVSDDLVDLTGDFSKGVSTPAWRVDMQRADGATASWWFGKEQPNVLLRFVHSDGRQWKLISVERSAYWEVE